jgi:hypothetical protein
MDSATTARTPPGPSDAHKRSDGMDDEDDEIAHPLSYQFPNPNTLNVLGISPGTGILSLFLPRFVISYRAGFHARNSAHSKGPIALQYGAGVVKFRLLHIKPL